MLELEVGEAALVAYLPFHPKARRKQPLVDEKTENFACFFRDSEYHTL
jgi:hypothetical protein